MNEVQSLLINVIGTTLFGGEVPVLEADKIEPLIKESRQQTVFPLLFNFIESQIKNALSEEKFSKYSEINMLSLVTGVRNFAEHEELHKLMTDHNIPYVAMKGIASAMYYPKPSLRTAGDVDFLVDSSNLQKVSAILENNGFVLDHGEADDIHMAYKREPMSIWEVHTRINGVPDSLVGQQIQNEVNKMIDDACIQEIDGMCCLVPNKFHHGLILLLHTISHLTSEGVGLRHLCDWVVFASSLSDDEFVCLFSDKLKKFGLWRFAQILTLLGIRYLKAPERIWALELVEKKEVTYKYLEELITDIFNGGNFGRKDMNRYREIKYIANRGEGTVTKGSVAIQGFKTLNKKVYSDFKFIDKYRLFLPVGWVIEVMKYISMLTLGKRKTSDTKKMLKEANQRKKIYASFKLFDVGN